MRTFLPSATRRSTTCEPMKPAPPVTRIVTANRSLTAQTRRTSQTWGLRKPPGVAGGHPSSRGAQRLGPVETAAAERSHRRGPDVRHGHVGRSAAEHERSHRERLACSLTRPQLRYLVVELHPVAAPRKGEVAEGRKELIRPVELVAERAHRAAVDGDPHPSAKRPTQPHAVAAGAGHVYVGLE